MEKEKLLAVIEYVRTNESLIRISLNMLKNFTIPLVSISSSGWIRKFVWKMLKNFFYLLLLCVSIPLKFEKKIKNCAKKSLWKVFQDFLMENSKIYFYEIKTFIFTFQTSYETFKQRKLNIITKKYKILEFSDVLTVVEKDKIKKLQTFHLPFSKKVSIDEWKENKSINFLFTTETSLVLFITSCRVWTQRAINSHLDLVIQRSNILIHRQKNREKCRWAEFSSVDEL